MLIFVVNDAGGCLLRFLLWLLVFIVVDGFYSRLWLLLVVLVVHS